MKNLLLTIALLMALMIQSVQGQYALTSVVADGTSTTRYLPAIQAYGQEVCQSLYPSSEIIEFGYGDTITKLHFYVASGSWNSVLAYEVRMANTTATSLAGSFDTTASTLVYTGTLTANTTAGMDILLDTPFVYEGGNLLVDVSTTNTGYSGTAYFYAKPMTGGGRMRNGSSARSEGTVVNFLPKCEFTFLPYSESCPRPRYNISISDITSVSAVIDWRASGASRWNIQYRANGDTGWTSINGVTPRYKLRGLQPNTVYYFRIQADCGSDVSTWTNGISFRTLNNGADIVSFTPTAEVITPTVFDAVHRTVTTVVRYNTDLTNLSYTVQLSEHATAYLNGSQFPSTGAADFTNPLTVRVVPEDSTTAVNWTIAVVNEECATPYNLKAKNVSRRTADLEWNVSDLTATTFDVVIDTVAHTDSTLTTAQSVTVSNVNGVCTYPLAGLTRGTHYYTYVRTNCGTTVGQWRSVEFTTLTPPYSTHETVSSGSSYNYNIPFSCQKYDGKFTKSQFIYPSSMLTALRGKTLNRMTFFSVFYSYEALGGIIEVRIGITNSDSIDTAYEPSPSTVVYRGPVTGCDHKWEFYFWTNTFAYPAGGGNLLVEMNVLSSGGRTNDLFYGTTGNATGCSRYTENGTESTLDFLPKVQFDYCEAMITCPEVTGITATNIGSSTADIRWTESTGDFAGASELFYSLTQVADSSITNPQYTNINGTTQTLSGLAPDTVYYVYVRTHCNAEGNDDGWSNWAEGRFRTEMTCTYPRNVVASVTDKNTIHIQWTDKTGASTAGDTYEVYYSTTQAEPTTAGTTTTLGYYDATGLMADTTYYCYVRKSCGGTAGCSPWIECQATTPAAMPAVLNLTATYVSFNAFRATWNRDDANFANETQWEYACVATGTTPAAWNTITDSTLDARQSVSTTISGLTESTTYDLYVRPTDGTNRGAAAMITVTTTASPTGCRNVVDTGTYNATTYVPAYSNKGSTYSVSIYTAQELKERGYSTGTIASISYYQKSCGDTATANKYQKMTTVWMGNTADTAIMSYNGWISGLTMVKAAGIVNFNKVNDLVTIPLDNGFEWDGVSNLAVGILTNTTGSYTTMSFDNAQASGGYKELYGTSDLQITVRNGVPSVLGFPSVSYSRIYNRPNIQFCYDTSISCPKPANLVVDRITATSARASWCLGGTESSWNYYVSTTAMTDSALNATATTATTSMVNDLNGLNSDTEYYLYVRSNCCGETHGSASLQGGSTTDSSAWKVKQFRTLIACSDPINAVAVNSAANQITFDAAAGTYGTVGTYDFRYWADGSTDTTTVAGQTSQLTVDSLPDGVTYHWQVRANCTCGDSSYWVTGNDVSVCCVFNVDSTHPFTEGFEDPGFVSGCWTNQHVAGSGTDLWWRSTSDKHSGTSSATLFNLSSGDRTNLVTPKLNIPTANAYEVSFWMNRSAQVRSNEGVKVWVNTQNNTTGGTEFMYISRYYAQAPTESGAGWYKYSATIPTSGDVYIVFEGIENGGAFLRIDDISVNLGTTAYTLSTSVAPSAAMGRVEVSANATDTTTDGRFKCLTTPTLRALANPGYQFSGWSNGQTVGTINVCMTKDTTLVAQFEALPYNLNVVAAPGSEDHGTVAGGGYYKHSTVRVITATPDPHYRVVWQDGDTSTSRTIIMPAADTTFIATFVGDSFTIAATCDASMGSVTGAGRYAHGDTVTLTAVPAPHHHFFNWSNGTTTNPLTFVVTKDESFRANFTAESYTVTVNVNDSTAGTVTGAGTYGYGSTVTLIAHPAEGYKLDEWRMGGLTYTTDTLRFVISGDTIVDAVFILAPVSVDQTEAESYIAYSNGLSIVITGVENSTVAVYDITGKLVKMVKSAGENECVNVYAAGVYIIRIDNRKTLRVVVK